MNFRKSENLWTLTSKLRIEFIMINSRHFYLLAYSFPVWMSFAKYTVL